MTSSNPISFCFVASAQPHADTNRFTLLSSSLTKTIGSVEAQFNEIITSLENLQKISLPSQVKLIKATLIPVIENSVPRYQLSLMIDEKPALTPQRKLLQITLKPERVQAFLGQSSAPSIQTPVLEKPKIAATPATRVPSTPNPPSSSVLLNDWVEINSSPEPSLQQPQKSTSLFSMVKNLFGSSPSQELPKTPATPPSTASFLPPSQKEVQFYKGIRPLRNERNDCFLNAVFQIIMQDKKLLSALLNTFKHDSSSAAKSFVEAVKCYREDKSPLSATQLRNFINKWGSQEDASEFMMTIISKLNSAEDPTLFAICTTYYEWERQEPPKNPLAPRSHQTEVSSMEFLLPIQLPMAAESTAALNGQQLVNNTLQILPQEGETAMFHETLYRPKAAMIQIEDAPQRLVLQLKRFTKTEKIQTPVDMPEILQVHGTTYSLKSILVHTGVKNGGHYYSMIQKEGEWIKTNDEQVIPVKDISLERQSGYLYFYEKVED